MRRRRSYAGRRRSVRASSVDYFSPFLILLCVGVISMLVFNLWKALFSTEVKKGAFMHIVDGSVQMKTWGTEEFFALAADALVLQGDELATSADARVIVEFFDGTIMRMAGNTGVVFEEMRDDDGDKSIKLTLVDGNIWLNTLHRASNTALLEVGMDSVNVIAEDAVSVFALGGDADKGVRVVSGDDVLVNVLAEGSETVIESEEVGVGQEMVFSDEVLERYYANQSPNVLRAVSDSFENTEWRKWNLVEDANPTKIEKEAFYGDANLEVVEPEEVEGGVEEVDEDLAVEGTGSESEDGVSDLGSEDVVEPVVEGSFAAPTITSVAGKAEKNAEGYFVNTARVATLTGSVPEGAESVVVNGYTLTKFVAGDSTWTYYANADFQLMVPGKNTYEVYALDAEGNKGGVLNVKVLYEPPADTVLPKAPVEEPVSEEEVGSEDAGEVAGESVTDGVDGSGGPPGDADEAVEE